MKKKTKDLERPEKLSRLFYHFSLFSIFSVIETNRRLSMGD